MTSNDDVPAASAPANERFGGDLGGRELLIVLPVLLALVTLSVWPNIARRSMNQPPVAIQAHQAKAVVAAAGSSEGKETHE
jgi:hypothetical protein